MNRLCYTIETYYGLSPSSVYRSAKSPDDGYTAKYGGSNEIADFLKEAHSLIALSIPSSLRADKNNFPGPCINYGEALITPCKRIILSVY